jgi:hypothetical protein
VTLLTPSLSAALLVVALAMPQAPAAPAAQAPAGPESFDVTASVTPKAGAAGAVTIPMIVQLDRYTAEYELTKMTDALKYGGYPGFLNALRVAPVVGSIDAAGEAFKIRWARSVPSATGRTVSIVTDTPVFFIGAGRKDAKPTAGYEVAVMQLVLDKNGKGTGTMAAAARVKPGGETGVRIDSYAETPVKLTAAPRKP